MSIRSARPPASKSRQPRTSFCKTGRERGCFAPQRLFPLPREYVYKEKVVHFLQAAADIASSWPLRHDMVVAACDSRALCVFLLSQ